MEPKIPLWMGGRISWDCSAQGAAAQQSICDTRAGPAVAALPLLHPSPGSRISCGMRMLVFITRVCQCCFPFRDVPGQVLVPAVSSLAFRSSDEPDSQDRLLLPATASTGCSPSQSSSAVSLEFKKWDVHTCVPLGDSMTCVLSSSCA